MDVRRWVIVVPHAYDDTEKMASVGMRWSLAAEQIFAKFALIHYSLSLKSY
jgi:hypothetical protein